MEPLAWDASLWASLPEDVASNVFELAAVKSAADSLSLATVSRKVKSWVEPIIYREVSVDQSGLFVRTIRDTISTKPSNFFALHVKSVFIDWDSLEKCLSVRSVALWVATRPWPPLWAFMGTNYPVIAPRRLSLTSSALDDSDRDFSRPIFREVTHLDLGLLKDQTEVWKGLTHLRKFIQTVGVIIAELPPTLQVLVIGHHREISETDLEAIVQKGADHRAVLLRIVDEEDSPPPPSASLTANWQNLQDESRHPLTTSSDLWRQARDVVQQQLERRRSSSKAKTISTPILVDRTEMHLAVES
ncbi:hypothetical protein DFP72DRAFT_880469 [Ephemerocybe angulata]|uniref:Uncharacterized protein n=1 Tax=Ephemerocybe angulata TaxID=980116 RepID=A0A8H6I980_9AGAR|nr:hypothetical protein DFP72DRAFT_880469 [Tulosesus angulatus]